jgi:hypothetical protein
MDFKKKINIYDVLILGLATINLISQIARYEQYFHLLGLEIFFMPFIVFLIAILLVFLKKKYDILIVILILLVIGGFFNPFLQSLRVYHVTNILSTSVIIYFYLILLHIGLIFILLAKDKFKNYSAYLLLFLMIPILFIGMFNVFEYLITIDFFDGFSIQFGLTTLLNTLRLFLLNVINQISILVFIVLSTINYQINKKNNLIDTN